jgi:hypothetical protein
MQLKELCRFARQPKAQEGAQTSAPPMSCGKFKRTGAMSLGQLAEALNARAIPEARGGQ